jgi:rhodanese-related sulfurtransferase
MRQIAVEDLGPLCAEQATQVTLLDVREPWEVATATLSVTGVPTVHIPMREVPARLGELDTTRLIVCLCHHGVRSLQVVAFLSQRGFANVYNLAGGIDAWSLRVAPQVPRY